MTARQRDKARRDAQRSLELLLTGWQGALLSTDASAPVRSRAGAASQAARRALSAGTPPDEVVVTVLAPVFMVPGDERG